MAKKTRYTKAELKKFKTAILKKMEQVASEMEEIKEGITDTGPSGSRMSPDSIYSLHMADAGTDSHEREKNYLLMTRENNHYRNLSNALERIEDGTFGICVECADVPKNLCPTCPLIPEERLMEVPNASKCVAVKERDKLNLL